MHDRNIVHRDVSLENFVLSKEMKVKMIDFGLAHEYKDGNFRTECTALGKLGYISPECFNNHYYDGRHNDLWGFGVSLWMCLIGAPPWDAPHRKDKRYCYIMRGIAGIKSLLTIWQRDFMCPDSAMDLLSKIFRPEKDRITVDEALKHPFITGRQFSLIPDPYIPAELGRQRLDKTLCREWEVRRRQEKMQPPGAWSRLSQDKKDEIQNFLWKVDKHRGCVFDRRVVSEMTQTYKINNENARDILIYYMAASRNRVKLSNSAPRVKPSPVLQFHNSEQKAQEHHDDGTVIVKAVAELEGKEDLVLRASLKKDEHDAEVFYPLKVKVGATLNQIKVDFALLRTKKLNTPFITPAELEILVNGEGLEDTKMLREGCIISSKSDLECDNQQWFSEVPNTEREMFLNNNPDENSQQKLLEMLETKFQLEAAKCLKIWKYFIQNDGEGKGNQNAHGGSASEYDWLKVLYTDAKGKFFALTLSAIVVANIRDKRASIALLEEKGLTREKAVQTWKHFSRELGDA